MNSYKHPVVQTLRKRLSEPVRHITIIAGPRQVGKTTGVLQALELRPPGSFRFVSVDQPEDNSLSLLDGDTSFITTALADQQDKRDAAWLSRVWRAARTEARAWLSKEIERSSRQGPGPGQPPHAFVLVLDEIQSLPQWSTLIKGLWDQDRRNDEPLHVVALGSAPLLMQQGLTESLMGRYQVIPMTHWSFPQMQEAFDFTLDQYLYFGGYPGPAAWARPEEEDRWVQFMQQSLIAPNLNKDILAMSRIEKPALLCQLFELGSSYSGQVMAMTKLLGQLQDAGNTTTLTHYLSLLSNAGLLTGLAKFSPQQMRQRASKPKLNVLNTAFLAVASGLQWEQAKRDRSFWGRLVESAIGAHLLNTLSATQKLFYWQESPHEVDFVLAQGQKVLAIEVKSSAPKSGARAGLHTFAQRFESHHVKTCLVGGDVHALAEALSTPATEWFDKEWPQHE